MFGRAEQQIRKRDLDYVLAAAVILLSLIGLSVVISAVNGLAFAGDVVRTHLIALPVAFCAFIFGWLFNYQIYSEQNKALYIFILALLGAVLLFGVVMRGSNSWFRFGSLSFQPTEICRIATILVCASFLARRKNSASEFKTLFYFSLLVLPIFFLIMRQPDFSSIVVTGPALLFLLYTAGFNIFYFILVFMFVLFAGFFPIVWTYIAMAPAAAQNSFLFYAAARLMDNWAYILGFCGAVLFVCWLFWWFARQLRITLAPIFVFVVAGAVLAGFFSGWFVYNHMKPYQRKRIETFLAPQSDPKGAGYNVLQAQIAMGSGGVLGKGYFSGTQSRLGFVPERHTDFILAVLGEERGLLGMMTVLILYIILLWRTAQAAALSSDYFGYLVCCGIFGIFFVYMIFNFGMLIGLVPVAGIPLPFISYGGSNLVASAWAFGIVESVYKRRLSII